MRNVPINILVEGCPKKGVATFSDCRSCQFFKGMIGLWPHAKVRCNYWGKPVIRKVNLLIGCPFKNKNVKFKDCIKCPFHSGFYGFHNNEPVVYCNADETPSNRKIDDRMLVLPFAFR